MYDQNSEPIREEADESPAAAAGPNAGWHLWKDMSINQIVEKMIPIVGALFLTIGCAYFIYTEAWVHFPVALRLALGFMAGVLLIGVSYSLADKLKFFTDIGIGSGILLLYATLIYGSRTTDVTTALIPEVATLVSAFIFIILIAYFASRRKSLLIMLLGIIGSYLTPFVIGQSDTWTLELTFNAYLIYFAAVNFVIFLLGREISIRRIIPFNIIGLFASTSLLYKLSFAGFPMTAGAADFFNSEFFTAFLMLVLVVFSTWSILVSARQFREKYDSYLALGYLAPLVWFYYNINQLEALPNIGVGVFYTLIAASYFAGWHWLKDFSNRFQHLSLYAAGLLSAVLAFFAVLPELDVYSSMAVAYLSLIFAGLYLKDPSREERFISYILVSIMGSILSLVHILDSEVIKYESIYIVIAFIPAMSAHFIAKRSGDASKQKMSTVYSFSAFIVALMFVLQDLIDYIDIIFLIFYLVPFLYLLYMLFLGKPSTSQKAFDFKQKKLQLILIWFTLAFPVVYLYLFSSIYPAPADTYIFSRPDLPTDWILIKGIFAAMILFTALFASRRLQKEQPEKKPSFGLVFFAYSSLLLIGNYIILALHNDFNVSMEAGGPRAIFTTLWWIVIALVMISSGVRYGRLHYAEKILGVILLAITIVKVLLYDITVMGMQNKVLVLIAVGIALLVFSFGIHSKKIKEKNS